MQTKSRGKLRSFYSQLLFKSLSYKYKLRITQQSYTRHFLDVNLTLLKKLCMQFNNYSKSSHKRYYYFVIIWLKRYRQCSPICRWFVPRGQYVNHFCLTGTAQRHYTDNSRTNADNIDATILLIRWQLNTSNYKRTSECDYSYRYKAKRQYLVVHVKKYCFKMFVTGNLETL